MTQPRVVMASMWRNDTDRAIVDRVEHLLAKAENWPSMRFVWVVGDSTDGTADALRDLTIGYDDVTILDIGNTGIVGDDPPSRLRRLSVTGNHYWPQCDGADYVLVHESDLLTPYDLVPRMVADAERGICPAAAWPVITLDGQTLCYDVWALRKDGVRFSNLSPYHKAYRADRPFVVDSFGSVFMFHGEDAPLLQMDTRAVLDVCQQLREQGRTLWVDPLIVAEQPADLWVWQRIEEAA